jgi:hypothetical protein
MSRYKGTLSSIGFLGGLLDVGDRPVPGEFLSYLLFDEEFANELIQLGETDADAWLEKNHGVWRTSPLPDSRDRAPAESAQRQ